LQVTRTRKTLSDIEARIGNAQGGHGLGNFNTCSLLRVREKITAELADRSCQGRVYTTSIAVRGYGYLPIPGAHLRQSNTPGTASPPPACRLIEPAHVSSARRPSRCSKGRHLWNRIAAAGATHDEDR